MSDVPIVPMEALLAHEGWLRGLARSLVVDDARADDVVQETWATALREPPRAGGSIRAWLASVVRSRAADARKAERRRVAREAAASWRGEAAPGRDPVVDAAAATEIHRRLTRAVMELDEPYRSAVILRFFEGLPPRDVGARTGVPAATARTRVNRGLAMLRERFDAEDGGRRRWTALLVPIAGLGLSTETNGPSAGTAGAAAMATAKTFGTAAALVALCVGAWWWLRGDGVATTPSSADAAKTKTESMQRPPRTRTEPATPAPPPSTAETTTPASAAPPPGAAVRLRFVDENGAPLAPEAVKARWGGGGAAPSVALFDDRALRSANRSDWMLQTIVGAGDALRPQRLDETSGTFALGDRAPRGRWRLLVFPGAAISTLTRTFTVAKDGDAVDVDVVLAATPTRIARVVRLDGGDTRVVAGARLTPFFEAGDAGATFAGPAFTTDAAGEARLPIDDGDARRRGRPPTWWATAPGGAKSFQVRSDASAGDAVLVVRLSPTFDVEGDAFLDDGSPAAGRSVCWSKGRVLSTTCDAAGHFRLEGLDASAPTQTIFLVEDAARGILRSGTVATKSGGTATIRFDAPAADMGRVVVRLTAGGRPVRGMAVTCRENVGGTMALTDADGSATLTGIPAGAAPTVVVLLCDPRVAQDFTANATPTPLATGEVRKLSLDLPVGAIRVRVVGADGSPVPGAHVIARPADKSTLDANDAATAPSPDAWAVKYGDARFADDDGAALLTGLPAGATCEVVAVDGVAGLKASASVVPGTSDAPAEVALALK